MRESDEFSVAVTGSWLHAHEEDREGLLVFRPARSELPPSRGRLGLELRGDHRARLDRPGATDAGEVADGEWGVEGGALSVTCRGELLRYLIVSTAPDRLVLREVPDQASD